MVLTDVDWCREMVWVTFKEMPSQRAWDIMLMRKGQTEQQPWNLTLVSGPSSAQSTTTVPHTGYESPVKRCFGDRLVQSLSRWKFGFWFWTHLDNLIAPHAGVQFQTLNLRDHRPQTSVLPCRWETHTHAHTCAHTHSAVTVSLAVINVYTGVLRCYTNTHTDTHTGV